MVTAGPTYEAIDPVRFVSNHSTGKMGFAIAEELYLRGAEVTLITGPTDLHTNYIGIKVKPVVSAEDMHKACTQVFKQMDIAIMSAAVADYKPTVFATEKIKKKSSDWNLKFTKTEDILYNLGKQKKKHQFLVGFALETNNEKENALHKLQQKNADCIILNSLKDTNAGFGFNTNKITILHKDGTENMFELKTKKEVAKDIVSYIITKA